MRTRTLAQSATPLLWCAAAAPTIAQPQDPPLVRASGPDTVIGSVYDARTLGAAESGGVLRRAFAIGAEVWNTGDRPVNWDGASNSHAVIVQNLYRAQGDSFRQIGLSWVKHVVATANLPFDPDFGPCIPVGFTHLGVNCSDVYSSLQNAGQGGLGPRFDVNPATGAYTLPQAPLAPPVPAGDALARRVVTRDADVQPGEGVAWYGETAALGPDDCGWGNARNSFGSRTLIMPAFSGGDQPVLPGGPTFRMTALEHWAATKPAVALCRADLYELDAPVTDRWVAYQPGDTATTLRPQPQWVTLQNPVYTRFIAASVAAPNEDGTWTYRFALMNLNSHRAGSALRLRLPAAASVTAATFSAPEYHSGDRVRNAPWAFVHSAGVAEWRVDPATETRTLPSVGAVTFEPNALRYATVYSFALTVNAAPETAAASLELWRPPSSAAGFQGSQIALSGLTIPRICRADVGGTGGAAGPDGMLDNNDFIAFIDAYFNGDTLTADTAGPGAQQGPDNTLDNNDFVVFIDGFFAGCN